MYFLGIDIGTTNTKGLLLSDQLEIIAEGTAGYPIHFLGGGGVEQSPDDWWTACCNILKGFWKRGINPHHIKGIAVSGHGASLVVVDENGESIRPAISSLDTRCTKQKEHIREKANELILNINGNSIGAWNFEPKLLWMRDTEPENYKRMPHFLTATSFINYKLTGQRFVNISDGGIALTFDRKSGDNWSSDIAQAIGIEEDKYPTCLPCSDIIGSITRDAAEATGLPEGIPVLAGGEDTSSAALGVGVVDPGQAYMSLGTQGTVGVCTDQFEIRPEILGFPHVIQSLNLLSGSMSSVGAGMQWFVEQWCKDLIQLSKSEACKSNVFKLLEELCEKHTKPGSNGLLFLPYLSGELHPIQNEAATGVFFGLKLEHKREHMARAVMEGTAHAIRHNLSYAESVSGKVNELRAVGGPTRNTLWCQIMADVTQRPIKVIRVKGGDGGAPLGNAILAMNKLTGQDIKGMLSQCLKIEREYIPNKNAKSIYDSHHQVYKKLYPQIRDLFPQIKIQD